MMSIVTTNKAAFFLLVLIIVGLLTVLAVAIVSNVNGLEIASDPTILRYCVSSGGVCTGGA